MTGLLLQRQAPGALALLGIFGWWADRHHPWLLGLTGPGRYRPISRAELLEGHPGSYEHALLYMPSLAWGLLGAAGLLLVGIGFTKRWPTLVRIARRVLIGACATAGFLLLIAGARWLGFYFARLMDTGPSIVHLHVLPYLHLATGAGLLAWSLWSLQGAGIAALPSRRHEPAVRTLLAMAWMAAATLVVMPLLPYASNEPVQERSFHYDELTIAVLAENEPFAGLAHSLAAIRTATWGIVILSVAALIGTTSPGVLPTSRRWQAIRGHLVWVTLPAVVMHAVYGVLFLDDARRLASEFSVGPNFIPPVAAVGLLATLIARAYGMAKASRASPDPMP